MSWQHEAQSRSARLSLLQTTDSSAVTNWWAQKLACLYTNYQYSGVGSDWGRGDLHNVIFNSSDICIVFVSIFVINKGPTLFPLLPLRRSSHCPRNEEYRRIAFLLPAQFLSFYCLWRQAGDSSPYAQICSTVTNCNSAPSLSPTATLLSSTAAVYVTSYPNLFTVKFPILTFFRPGNHFNIISQIIFFLPTLSMLVNNLTFTTCQHLFNSHFWLLSKVLFPEFQFYTSWQLYLAAQFNPSCTNATDQYCHNRTKIKQNKIGQL